jgi:hypothetical protein
VRRREEAGGAGGKRDAAGEGETSKMVVWHAGAGVSAGRAGAAWKIGGRGAAALLPSHQLTV